MNDGETRILLIHRKLIDRLSPDLKDGHVEAILATSAEGELDPDFFDTDLLPTLLGSGAWDDLSWRARVASNVR